MPGPRRRTRGIPTCPAWPGHAGSLDDASAYYAYGGVRLAVASAGYHHRARGAHRTDRSACSRACQRAPDAVYAARRPSLAGDAGPHRTHPLRRGAWPQWCQCLPGAAPAAGPTAVYAPPLCPLLAHADWHSAGRLCPHCAGFTQSAPLIMCRWNASFTHRLRLCAQAPQRRGALVSLSVNSALAPASP